MTAGMHRRPSQRRDALHAAARDTWTLIRLSWITLTTLISRRVTAAGGATATTPPAEAPEVPALPTPVPGAGTSPHLWPGGPATAPAGSRRSNEQQLARAPQLPGAAPGEAGGGLRAMGDRGSDLLVNAQPASAPKEVTAPASPGAAARPWFTVQPPPGSPMPAYRGDYRPTQPFRAAGPVPASVTRPYYPALQAWRDMPAAEIKDALS